MLVLVSVVQEAAALHSIDDAWNLLASLLDAGRADAPAAEEPADRRAPPGGAPDLRRPAADRRPVRARDQWGSFVLGHPADDDAKADSWSISSAPR